jgi:hypothetical protein
LNFPSKKCGRFLCVKVKPQGKREFPKYEAYNKAIAKFDLAF